MTGFALTSGGPRRVTRPWWREFLAALLLTSAQGGADCLAAPVPGLAPTPGEIVFVYFSPENSSQDVIQAAKSIEKGIRGFERLAHVAIHHHTFSYFWELEQFVKSRRGGDGRMWVGLLPQAVVLRRRQEWGLVPIMQILSKNEADSYAIEVLVRRDGGIERLEDLKGKVVASTELWGDDPRLFDEWVLGGRIRLARDLRELRVTGSAISAFLALGYRDADAALVPSSLLDRAQSRFPWAWRTIKRIHVSPPVRLPALVRFGEVDAEMVANLIEALGRLHELPEWVNILKTFDVSRFVPTEERSYLANVLELGLSGYGLEALGGAAGERRPGE